MGQGAVLCSVRDELVEKEKEMPGVLGFDL
jgi:hypothetical protein